MSISLSIQSRLQISVLKKWCIILMLGFSSGLPLSLVAGNLQAWFAHSGMSVLVTGSLSLLGLPYVYRFLLTPLLDKYSILGFGKRRSWLFVFQILLCLGFGIISFLSPINNTYWMVFLGLCLALFSALQDSVIDAHRIEYLSDIDKGMGVSLAGVGYRVALLLFGGLGLVMAEYWGFAVVYQLASLSMLIGLIATYLSPEPSAPWQEHFSLQETLWIPIKQICQKPHWISFLSFILFYKLGEAFTASFSGVVMPFLIQGLGFSLDTIGFVNKIMGTLALVLGGFIAGFALYRYSLYYVLWVFGLLQAAANVLFVLLAMKGPNIFWLSGAVITDNLASGMGSTALSVLLMRWVDQRFTATQFSILVAIAMIPRTLSGWIAGVLQPSLGWIGLYSLSVVLALGFGPYLWRIRHEI